MHHLPETAEQIKVDKKEKIKSYLKTNAEYYSEEMQMAENREDKKTTNLILQNSRFKQWCTCKQ